jgi:alkanesulfonate monooxygenase SsuD/methylene tetrahydromethanopterin reductase-like flavin-dependent oxidoreductase (luciferase family)
MVLGLIGGSIAQARRTVDIYRAAGELAGHAAAQLSVGISTHFFAAGTPTAAREVFPYYHEYLRPKSPGGRGFLVDRGQFESGTGPGNALMIGSPAELIVKLVEAHEVLGLDRVYGQVDWGGLPQAMVEDSISRYATEIAPAVRAATGAAARS